MDVDVCNCNKCVTVQEVKFALVWRRFDFGCRFRLFEVKVGSRRNKRKRESRRTSQAAGRVEHAVVIWDVDEPVLIGVQ